MRDASLRKELPLGEHLPSENFDRALRELNELIESGNDRLTINNLALAERYLEGDLRLVLSFRIMGGGWL